MPQEYQVLSGLDTNMTWWPDNDQDALEIIKQDCNSGQLFRPSWDSTALFSEDKQRHPKSKPWHKLKNEPFSLIYRISRHVGGKRDGSCLEWMWPELNVQDYVTKFVQKKCSCFPEYANLVISRCCFAENGEEMYEDYLPQSCTVLSHSHHHSHHF